MCPANELLSVHFGPPPSPRNKCLDMYDIIVKIAKDKIKSQILTYLPIIRHTIHPVPAQMYNYCEIF